MQSSINLGLEIGRIDRIILRSIDAAVIAAIGDTITVRQAYVINLIASEGSFKPFYQKDLEKEFDVKRSSISLMLDNMEKNALIKRVLVEGDARLKKIELTNKALDLNEQIAQAIHSVESKLVKGIDEKDVETCLTVLASIRKNLE